MSEALDQALHGGGPGELLHHAQEMLRSGRTDALVAWIVEQLMGDSPWKRSAALDLLSALRPTAGLLDALSRDLGDETSVECRNAARSALATLAAPGAADPSAAVPRLVRLLAMDVPVDTRIMAALTLGDSGNPRVRGALERALRDPDRNVAAAAAESLGALGDPRAVDSLLAVAERGDFWTRSAAVVALGQLRDERAVPVLARALEEPWLASAAADALGEIGAVEGLDALRTVVCGEGEAREEGLRAAARILGRTPDLSAPDWLRQVLRTMEAELVGRFSRQGDAETSRLLGVAGTPSAAAALLDRLEGDGHAAASVGLEYLPGDVLTGQVLDRLDQVEVRDRALLLDALPPLVDPDDIARVAERLASDDAEERATAAEVLARSDADKVFESLARMAQRPEARLGIATAYGRMGSARCSPLLDLLGDADPAVREAAADGVGRCGLHSVDAIRAALRRETDSSVQRALVRALGAEGGADAVQELERALESDDPALRFEVARALGRTGERAALPALLHALDDPLHDVRVAALAALGELGEADAKQPLSAHLRDADRDERRTAARALDQLSPPDMGSVLLDALRDPDREVRLLALSALSRSRAEQAAEAVERLAEEDADALVRRVAADVAMGLRSSSERGGE